MTQKSLAPLGILAIALLGLTACDDDAGGEVTEPEEATAEETTEDDGQTDEEDAAETEEEPEEEEGEADSERPTFGDTWTYDDGLAVTISEPEEFDPSETSFGGEEFEDHVRFDVTIANESGEDFDPNLTSITAHSSGAEGDAVFDTEQGIDGPPETTLLDGQDTTFGFGFGVNDSADITVEFSDLDFESGRESVIFVSP